MSESFFEFESPQYHDPPRSEVLILSAPWCFVMYGILFIAPASGWPFDGASIPRLLWRAVGPPLRAKYRRGALAHDPAYKGLLIATQYLPSVHPHTVSQALMEPIPRIPASVLDAPRIEVTKQLADDLLRDVSIANGTHPARAKTLRFGVDNFIGRRIWLREHAKYAKLAS